MDEGAEIKGELCSALIDTGARSSMISPDLAKKLDLPVHSFTTFSSASEEDVRTKVYVVALWIPPPLKTAYNFVPVAEAPREFPNHQIILGREILMNWHITFDLSQGKYTICA